MRSDPAAGRLLGRIHASSAIALPRLSDPDWPTRTSAEAPSKPTAVLAGSDGISPGAPSAVAPTKAPGFATVSSPATVPLVSSRRQYETGWSSRIVWA